MLKLRRYLKRYTVIILAAIVLLLGQAILELNLPNMMSRIVDVGIQKAGIEEVSPLAMADDAYDLMLRFMSEEDAQKFAAAYTPYGGLSDEQTQDADGKYPMSSEKGAMIRTSTEADTIEGSDAAFGRASYAFMDFIQKSAEQSGGEAAASTTSASAELDFEALRTQIPMLLELPQEAIQPSIEISQEIPPEMTGSVAAVLNRAFYEDLGADVNGIQMGYIIRIGLIMLLLSVAGVVCAVGAGYGFARVGAGVARDLRRDIFAKVNGFSNVEMDKFSTASLITRTTNDVTQVQMLYTMGMRMLVFAPIMGIGGVVMALSKSLSMGWILMAAVLVISVAIGIIYLIVRPRFKRVQKLTDRLNLVSREGLTGMMVVRSFSNQDFQQKRFQKANEELTNNTRYTGRAMWMLFPVLMLVMNAVSLFIIWFGAEQIAASTIQVGDIMAFIQYSMQVIMAFIFIAMIFIMVPRAAVSAERIDEVLRNEEVIKDPDAPVHFEGKAKGEVVFENVNFRYDAAEDNVLTNISFTAKPGQTTAFIGSTGSGKSTLINLIPRFYDVTSGKITIDGVDVRNIAQEELRDNIGYVPQKSLLFSGDISYNLRFGGEDASEEELRTAAEIAQATEFINEMEDGFDTEIAQGGGNVSGGQRQRLSIARALVKKAPVYIFDDSFSALDFATDKRLRKALKPYTQSSAVLIVAQRISTIRTADNIIVLDNGHIVGMGKHEALMKECDTYREIAQSQLSEEELA